MGRNSVNYVNVLIDLESLYLDQGRFDEALRVSRESLEIVRGLMGSDSAKAAERSRRLGAILAVMGRYAEAEAAFRGPLAVADKLPSDALQVALIVGALANFLAERGRFEEAWPLQERAFPIAVKRLDADSPVLAMLKVQRALLLDGLGRFAEAEQQRAEGVAILRKISADDQLELATAFQHRAHALRLQGRLGEALAAAQDAVTMSRRLLGERDPRHAAALIELAEIQSQLSR
jgi:tetratricopeptide (TPR) repeat protein